MANEKEEAQIPTPVNILWEKTLLIPIFGTVDSQRAQEIMESMLKKILEIEAKVVIMDILGVAAVDSAVANHLVKITKSTKLMGCECIVSGISPAIAQTLVQLGVELGDVITTATLRDALGLALERQGLEVREAPKKKGA